ncbi:MAG: hypothetical protein JSS29_12630 [Proteobacteria bacterium]|nr:hypothetical protein [Pseudomonadota bacterium]
MSPPDDFERNARTVLEESVLRIDARTRSRLNQARHAALEAASAGRRPLWRSLTLVPATGAAAAALLVAVMLWHGGRSPQMPVLEGPHASAEDIDLLADSEGLELMENSDGSFYEWAAAQADTGESEG